MVLEASFLFCLGTIGRTALIQNLSQGLIMLRCICTWVVAMALGLTASMGLADGKPAMTKLTYDSRARSVELFKAMNEGLIEVKLIQVNARRGNLIIDNKVNEPLTIQMPAAFVGVNVLNQGGINGQGLSGLNGGLQNNGQQQAGGTQMTGGGTGAGGRPGGLNGNGVGLGNGLGNGFFSIPAEKRVRLAVNSVCLEYGKLEPNSKSPYAIREIESVSKDPVLKEVLSTIALGKTSENVAQAAAWHVANGKSWGELAAMKTEPIASLPLPMFASSEIAQAKKLVEAARLKSREAASVEVVNSKP